MRNFELITVAQALNDVSELYSQRNVREFRLPPRSEDCALLGYYAAISGNFFTEASGKLIGPIFRDYTLHNNPEAGSSQKVSFSHLARNTDNLQVIAVLLSHSRRRGE
jgi:hypothetical protein